MSDESDEQAKRSLRLLASFRLLSRRFVLAKHLDLHRKAKQKRLIDWPL
jgi:hypothetical protein